MAPELHTTVGQGNRLFSDLVYRLDRRDEIVWVNERWDPFAQENQGELLLAPGLLGRPLWEFISDMETRHIYRLLHHRVRSDGAPIGLSFRCDAPARRRLLGLNISLLPDEGLEYCVWTIEEVERDPVPLLDPHRFRSKEFVTMCGWCKRVHGGAAGWLEVEDAIEALSLFAEPLPPQVTHGVCEDCNRSLRRTTAGDTAGPVLGRV